MRYGFDTVSVSLEHFEYALACARSADINARVVGLCAMGYFSHCKNLERVIDDCNVFAADLNVMCASWHMPYEAKYLERDPAWRMPFICYWAALHVDSQYWLAHYLMSTVCRYHWIAWPLDSGAPYATTTEDWLVRTILLKPDFTAAYISLANDVYSFERGVATLDGVDYAPLDLILLAAASNSTDTGAYVELARNFYRPKYPLNDHFASANSIFMHDGSVMTAIDLCVEALTRDWCDGSAYSILFMYIHENPDHYAQRAACGCADGARTNDHVYFPDHGCLTLNTIGLRALQYGANFLHNVIAGILRYTVSMDGWAPRLHRVFSSVYSGAQLDRLFGTLLMGIDQLETSGVLQMSHHSMLEDMLETWTLQDSEALQ
jgi:hypothetical protein